METMAGRMVRQAECDDSTLTLTYNNNLSSEKVAADYNDDTTGEKCEGAGYKWCSELSTAACKKDCCSGVTLNSCQESCDLSTGEITNKEDETDCTTSDGKKGTCNAGLCEETPTCSSTVGDPCTDNATVCPGYYCSIAGGTTTKGTWCGDDTYIPGAGSVASLGTPVTKGSYKASPSPMTWDAAVNYCDALKRDGFVTHGRLVSKDVSLSNLGSKYIFENVWVKETAQQNCNDTSVVEGDSTSTYAFSLYLQPGGILVETYGRYSTFYALCE
jgi:hypothetical protein